MSDQTTDLAAVRAQAAAEERSAILEIVEHWMRHLAHGHGANGAQVLQHVADEIQRRGQSG
ncbi:MAG TPA: hypothetical protein VGR37_03350 [Longimicrobiaceae bacterium]|nr:hypothetical protein [Longimicrobiaceae bacterium]